MSPIQFYLLKKNYVPISTASKACFWLAAIPIAGVIGIHSVQAQPIVPAPDGTNTIVTPEGNRFDINGGQTSGDGANLFHSFTEFGLTEGQIANFLSRPDILNILARINGGNPSFINGLIQVTGGNSNLFLINPSGIIFGSNASLNVPGAFTATTANGVGFGNNWFNAIGTNNYTNLVGKPNAFAFTMSQPGNIVNFGNLGVGIGQDLNLLAGTIINTGQLSAPGGNITITAVPGESLVRLSQPGYLLNLEVNPIASNSNLPNNWNLSIATLPQMLTGGNGGSATGVIVNQDGSVKLTGSGITIPQEGNTNIASGTIKVSGEKGGQINILGGKVGVISGNINADGSKGGGTILIGGEREGKGTIPNAQNTFISKDSTISADAIDFGKGGQIIIFADETARVYGNILARGGKLGGDGGFVETSGKQNLEITTTPQIQAPAGLGGEWLIDPYDIEIVAGNGNSKINANNPFESTNNSAQLGVDLVVNALKGGSNVTITTGSGSAIEAGRITLNAELDYNGKGNNTLTLKAISAININKDITDSSPGGDSLNLILQAGGTITVTKASINTNGGNIKFTGIGADGDGVEFPISGATGIIIDNSTINSGTGSIALNGTGGKGDAEAGGAGILLDNNSSIISSSGGINLTGKGGEGDGVAENDGAGISIANSSITSNTGIINLTGTEGVGGTTNDAIDISGTSSISTNNNILLQTSILSQKINLGGTGVTAGLDLSQTEIDALQGNIIIGGKDNTGQIAIAPNGISFDDPVTLQSPTGTLLVNGDIQTNNNTLTLKVENIIINADIITGGEDFTINNPEKEVTLLGTGSVKTDGGKIDLTGTDIDTGVVTLNSSSASGTGGDVNLNASNKITVGGDIDASGTPGGTITFTGNEVNLNAGTDSVKSINGQVLLQPAATDGNLTVASGGNLDTFAEGFSQIIFGKADGTGKVIIDSSGVAFSDPVKFQTGGTIAVDGELKGTDDAFFSFNGKTDLGANITASQGITFTDAVTLKNDVTLDTSAGNGLIFFTKTLNSSNGENLTLNSGNGTIFFEGTVGNTQPLGKIIANSGGTTNFNDNITAASITTNAGGTTSINGNITTSGDQNYGDAVTLNKDVTLSSSGGKISFDNNIDNPITTLPGAGKNLTVIASGDIIFNGTIGNNTPLGNVNANSGNTTRFNTVKSASLTTDTNGTTELNGDITTTGDQNYNDAVKLNNDINLNSSGGNISFNNTIDGKNAGQEDLSVTTAIGNIGFKGAVGNSTKLGNLNIDNAGTLNIADTADINLEGAFDQNGKGTVSTAGDIITNNKNISFESAVTLNGNVKFNPGNANISFNSTLNANNNPLNLTAGEINFGDKVTGNSTLVLEPGTAAQNIELGGNGDPDTGSLELTAAELANIQNGFTSITIGRKDGSGTITFAAPIKFQDPVTIQSPKDAGAIAFTGGTISGEDNASISLIANQSITVGGITAPAGISITSNSGNIDSSAGILDATNAAGKGGDVNVNAAGNVTFFGIVASGNSDGGKISIVSGGNVAASTAGDIAADGKNGRGGDIFIDAKSDILTDDIFSVGSLGGGKITLNSGGTIDFRQVDKSLNTPGGTITCAGVDISCSGNGKGGDITFKATKDILTGEVNSRGSLGGGKVNITSINGTVFTGVNSSSSGGDGGEITIQSPVKINTTGLNSTGNVGTGNITLTSNEINFSGVANSVKGKGIIQLQPFTESQNLNIATTDFAALADGFTSIIIGTDKGSGFITLANPITFSDPTIIQSPSGAIFVNGAITGIDNASITIIGNTNLNSDLTTADRDITIKGNTSLGKNVTVSTGASSGGDINFNGTINGNRDLTLEAGTGNIAIDNAIGNNNRIGNLSINSATNVTTKDIAAASITQKSSSGNTSFGALNTNSLAGINLTGNSFSLNGTITTTDGGTVTINNSGLLSIADAADMNLDGAFKQTGTGVTATAGDITTTNDNISFSNPVNLVGNITLNPGNADINFGSTVDGGFDLKLIAGIGDITFTGNVGNQTRIGNLIIQNVNNFKAGKVTAASITQKAGTGTTTLGNLDTNTATGINLKGNSFNLNGNVNTTKSGGFTIDNSSPLNLAANTKFTLDGAFNQIGKGAVSTAANITTTNDDITFSSPVTLTGNVTLNTGTGAGNIKFGNTVDGSFDLDLIAGTGDITFVGAVGNQIRIGDLIIESANNLQADKITAASITQQAGTGTTTLGNLDTNTLAGINLKGNNFNFKGAVTTTNSGTFTIDNQNLLDIAANADFKLDGEFKQIGKGAVTTAGDITTTNDNITFNSPVTLKGNVAFNTDKGAGDIKFGNTVDGGFDLNLSAGTGNVTVIGAVGSETRIGNLTIDTANDVKAGNITAASINQKAVTGTTTLGALNTNTPQGISLSGNNFSLNGAIATTNSGTFTINNSGQINIADAADMKLDGTFNQTGKGAIFTAGDIITNNKDIRFTSPVSLTGNVTFSPGTATIAFGSILAAGNNPLTLTAGEIDFGGPVSGSNTLTLQPATTNRNVAIGTFIPGAWNLTSTEIAFLQNGFSSIEIGRPDSIGQATVGNITFQDPVVIRSGAGTIAQNGPIAGVDNASITLDSIITTLNSNITTTGGNITIGRNVSLAKDVTLSTSNGNISFTGPIDGNQQLNLNASGNVIFNAAVGSRIPLSNLNIISAANALVAGGINTTNSLQFNLPVLLTADSIFSTGVGKEITFNAIVSATKANNFILNPNTGNVTFNSSVINVGDISIVNANNFTAAGNIKSGSLLYTAGKGNINLLGNVTTNGTNGVDLRTNGTINTNNIISNGRNITIISNNNPITTGNLDASSTTKTGGNIFVSSPTAAVTTNDLNARGVEAGGNVTVISGDRINTGNIDVSATIGKAGNVFLDPPNDIQVGSINAQGGTSGTGGNVDITTASFFRAIGAFSDINNINASISTAGGTGGGSIIIRHGGGDLNTPFVVGNTNTPNGTLGALTSGEFTISPVQSFPGLYTLGNIQLITSTPLPPPPPPVVEPPPPVVELPPPVVELPPPVVEPPPPVVEPPPPVVEPPPPVVEPFVEPVIPTEEPIETNNPSLPSFPLILSAEVISPSPLLIKQPGGTNYYLILEKEPLPALPSLNELIIVKGLVPESPYLIASPSLPFPFESGLAKPTSLPIGSSTSEPPGQFGMPINVSLEVGTNVSGLINAAISDLKNTPTVLYSYHQGSNLFEATFTSINNTTSFIFQPPVVVEGNLTTPPPDVAYSTYQPPTAPEGNFLNTPGTTAVPMVPSSPNVPEVPETQNSTTVSTNVPETFGSTNTPTNSGLNGSEVAIQPFSPSEQINTNNTSTTSTNNTSQPSTSSTQSNPTTSTASSGINRGSTSRNSSGQNNQNVPNSSSTSQRGQTTNSSGQNNQNVPNSSSTSQRGQTTNSSSSNNQNTSASNAGSQTRQAGTSTEQNTQISSNSATRGERGQSTTSPSQDRNSTVSNSSSGNQPTSSGTSTVRQNSNSSASSSTTQTDRNTTASSGSTARADGSSPSVRQTDPNTMKIAQKAQECEQQVDYIRRTKPGQRSETNYEKLIECYLQNLAIARQFKNQQWEQYALNNLAVTYFVVGDYAKSIEYHKQHLELARQIENRMGEALALGGIGAAYGALGDYKKAIKFYSQSLAITESIPAPQWEGPTLRNLGNAYLAQKNYPKAIEYQEKSLAFSRQNQDRYGEAQALGNLGNAYSALGEFQKAIEYHEQSLAISREIGDRLQEAQGLLNIGTTYSAEGNYTKALEYHQQSLAIVQELRARLGEGIALTNLGDALFHLRQLIEAEQRLYAGVEVWESLRSALGNNDENRVSIFEIQSNTYRNLQEVLSDRSKIEAALEISEQGRARAYSDLLARRLGEKSNSQVSIDRPNIEQIKEIARKQNATIVEYSITYSSFNVEGKRQIKESELFIWVVKPTGEVAFRRIDIKFLWQQQNSSLSSLVSTTREAIGLRGDPLTSSVPPEPVDPNDQEQQLKLLHKLLIKPIADLLPNNPEDHVIFIPQESLFLVPFAALQDESGKYLIEQHTILTAPAIQVLNLTDKQRQRVAGSGALVVGNPTMPRLPGKGGEPGEQLESLPGAEKEAIEIATLLNTQAITGDRATKLSILQELPKARIIHLATHGLLDDIRDLGVPGAIALAPSGKDDGFLTSSDILNLKLNAELVVLSACNTGKGKITGDGVIGLSRALVAAGVPSVVVSLWAVPDAPTAELMTEFYKQLQQNPDKAQALRQAMLATMKNNPDPKNWAAFTLIGEAE